MKTLLLAALVPGVESLKGLNANRLAALNHGTIKTPVPGKEGAEVLRRCRAWAAEVGEIKVGDEQANPSISLQLSGVDTERIIEQARHEDNQGNRVRLVRQMLFERLGIQDRDEFFLMHEFTWRQTDRACEVVFGNVRGLHDSSLEASGEDWKLLIDFPFDEAGHSPHDDLARLQKFRQDHPNGTRTLAWIPSFFRPQAQNDLGLLVILEHILAGERFDGYAGILPFQDRPVAKALLENQRSQLRQRVLHHLEVAYGVDRQSSDSVDTSHELNEHFESLWPGYDPQPPVGANLADAMQDLLEKALEHQFPAHPRFEAPPKGTNLRKVQDEVCRATQDKDGRIEVDKALRPLMKAIANPLLLGEMHETHFLLGRHWKNLFNTRIVEAGGTASVSQLRKWMDQPRPMGLPKPVQNLVILVYAEQTNRTFYLHGAATEVSLMSMPDQLELKEWVGPDEKQWEVAVQRAGSIFGLTPSALLNAANVTALAADAKRVASGAQTACRSLCRALQDRYAKFGIAAADAPRWKTASAVLALVDRLDTASANDVVGVLASADVQTSETAMGKSLKSAAALADCIAATSWSVFENIADLASEAEAAQAIRDKVSQALQADEHAIPLATSLSDAQDDAVELLARVAKELTKDKEEQQKPDKQTRLPQGEKLVRKGQQSGLDAEAARKLLAELQQQMATNKGRRLTIDWRITEVG